MKYQYKLATFVFILFMGTVLYIRYELELYTWFCENESNGAACYITSKMYQENKSPMAAEKYLEKSCKLKYEMACEIVNKKQLPK